MMSAIRTGEGDRRWVLKRSRKPRHKFKDAVQDEVAYTVRKILRRND